MSSHERVVRKTFVNLRPVSLYTCRLRNLLLHDNLDCTSCVIHNLTKVTPLFLINRACLSQCFMKSWLARCISMPFRTSKWYSGSVCHVRFRWVQILNPICPFPCSWSAPHSAPRSPTDPFDVSITDSIRNFK